MYRKAAKCGQVRHEEWKIMSRIYDFLPNGPDFMAGKKCFKANTANTVNAVTQKLFMHPLLLDIAIFIVST